MGIPADTVKDSMQSGDGVPQVFFLLFSFVLFCFVLFCFVLFCFVLFCFVLFCFLDCLI